MQETGARAARELQQSLHRQCPCSCFMLCMLCCAQGCACSQAALGCCALQPCKHKARGTWLDTRGGLLAPVAQMAQPVKVLHPTREEFSQPFCDYVQTGISIVQ